jgi:hypothetical protein
VTFNAHTRRICKFRIAPPALPGDNPQQSDNCAHIGLNSNYLCRQCDVGGSKEYKESNDGYHALHEVSLCQCRFISTHFLCYVQPGHPRSVAHTRNAIQDQLVAALSGNSVAHIKKLQSDSGVKDKLAQVWIDRITDAAKEYIKQHPTVTPNQIFSALRAVYTFKLEDVINPTLSVRGMRRIVHYY